LTKYSRPAHPIFATAPAISPGTQLFMLAATLFELGIYEALGDPAESSLSATQVEAWRDMIVS
jgi:hypothetical protein